MTVLIELEKEAISLQKRIEFYKTVVQNHHSFKDFAECRLGVLEKDLETVLESMKDLV